MKKEIKRLYKNLLYLKKNYLFLEICDTIYLQLCNYSEQQNSESFAAVLSRYAIFYRIGDKIWQKK